MNLTEFFDYAGKSFPVYPRVGQKFGLSANATILICLIGWKTMPNTDGWVKLTRAEIENETLLSLKEQATARRALKEKGLLEERYEPVTNAMFYRIQGNHPQEPKGTTQGKTERPPGQNGTSANIVPNKEETNKRDTFLALWNQKHLEIRKRPYAGIHASPKRLREEQAAAQRIVRDYEPGHLAEIAVAAWAHSGKEFWACRNKSSTVLTFADNLDSIINELNRNGGVPSNQVDESTKQWVAEMNS